MSFNVMFDAVKTANEAIAAAKAAADAPSNEAEGYAAQEQTIEDALEHAGISAVDVQIDANGFATLTGTVASEDEQNTALQIVEQFELTGLDVQITLEEVTIEEEDQTSIWDSFKDALQNVTYTTKKGDSWWGISKRFYGDGRKWKQLKLANGSPRMLHPNVELKVPPADQLPAV